LASFAIGIIAVLYVGRLENRIQRQRVREAENARDLQRLSSQLLTVQEEERRTIARELHDEVGQVLTALKVELAVAQHGVTAAGAAPDALDEARAIADSALHTVRDLSHLLHPSLLDDLGLAAALESYAKGFAKRHSIRVDVLHDQMDDRVAPRVEAAAYRIVQEALTNVVKHAHATSCRVYLQPLTNTLLVTIEDDGIGFDPVQVAESRGLGLIGIRERVAQLGGTIRLETAPGKGTRLTVELPARFPETPNAGTTSQEPADMPEGAVLGG
jgi:signal transduction histidine kinase